MGLCVGLGDPRLTGGLARLENAGEAGCCRALRGPWGLEDARPELPCSWCLTAGCWGCRLSPPPTPQEERSPQGSGQSSGHPRGLLQAGGLLGFPTGRPLPPRGLIPALTHPPMWWAPKQVPSLDREEGQEPVLTEQLPFSCGPGSEARNTWELH